MSGDTIPDGKMSASSSTTDTATADTIMSASYPCPRAFHPSSSIRFSAILNQSPVLSIYAQPCDLWVSLLAFHTLA